MRTERHQASTEGVPPAAPSARPLPRVLVVDDDDDVRLTTALVLQANGFSVTQADSGSTALSVLASQDAPAVGVFDVAMPGIDGIRLTRMVRETHQFPILLLTARDLPTDVVAGLDAGADDYVTKPFDGEVLAARLRALLRRHDGPLDEEAPASEVERYGPITIDRAALLVTFEGEAVALSATEFRLLAYLADNAGRVVSRAQILHAVWGDSVWTDARVVDTNVGRLRSKLGADSIETVRGFGYKLVAR